MLPSYNSLLKTFYLCIFSFNFQLKKLQDRVSKCKDEVNKSREKYQVALQDINNYNAKYMEEMTNV